MQLEQNRNLLAALGRVCPRPIGLRLGEAGLPPGGESRPHLDLLESWPSDVRGRSTTEILSDGNRQLTIRDRRLGEIRVGEEPGSLAGNPAPGMSDEEFLGVVLFEWLPFIYPMWGWQVLHASVAAFDDGRAVAFTGSSGAGKSTLGFALGRRPRWRQLADDCIAFVVEGSDLRFLPMPNRIRLRSPTAEHFGQRPGEYELRLQSSAIDLTAIYLVERTDDPSGPTAINPLPAGQAYVTLLEQAFIPAASMEWVRRKLAAGFLEMTGRTPVFRLSLPPGLNRLDEVLDELEAHASGAVDAPDRTDPD